MLYYVIDGHLIGTVKDTLPKKYFLTSVGRNDNYRMGFCGSKILVNVGGRQDKENNRLLFYHPQYITDKPTNNSNKVYTKDDIVPLSELTIGNNILEYDSVLIDTSNGKTWVCNNTDRSSIKLKLYNKYGVYNVVMADIVDVSPTELVCFLDDQIKPYLFKLTTIRSVNCSNEFNRAAVQTVLSQMVVSRIDYIMPMCSSLFYFKCPNIVFGDRCSRELAINSVDDVDKTAIQISGQLLDLFGIPSFPGWIYRFSKTQAERYKELVERISHGYISYSLNTGEWENIDNHSINKISNPFLPLVIDYYGVGASMGTIMDCFKKDEQEIVKEERKIEV